MIAFWALLYDAGPKVFKHEFSQCVSTARAIRNNGNNNYNNHSKNTVAATCFSLDPTPEIDCFSDVEPDRLYFEQSHWVICVHSYGWDPLEYKLLEGRASTYHFIFSFTAVDPAGACQVKGHGNESVLLLYMSSSVIVVSPLFLDSSFMPRLILPLLVLSLVLVSTWLLRSRESRNWSQWRQHIYLVDTLTSFSPQAFGGGPD